MGAVRLRDPDVEPVVLHGTMTRYKDYFCRCDDCRTANRDWQRQRATRLPARARVSKVEAWKTLHEHGVSGEACDQIVASREPPPRLLRALGLA